MQVLRVSRLPAVLSLQTMQALPVLPVPPVLLSLEFAEPMQFEVAISTSSPHQYSSQQE